LYTLGHLSDWHATSLVGVTPRELLGKRLSGWLSWKLGRRRKYRPEVLEALLDDLAAQRPDHVVITGDLTNVALEQEFVAARRWLERLGPPESVSLIPGNHDADVACEPARSWDYWAEYLRGDVDHSAAPSSPALAPTPNEYPMVWVRGELAVVGVCTAAPSPLFFASGSVGSGQLERLAQSLRELGAAGLCRVVLIHHPPATGSASRRRRLVDGPALCEVIAREGAELILHGHLHKHIQTEIPGPSGGVPVVGVRSASYAGEREDKRAQYHLYQIEPLAAAEDGKGGGAGYRIRTLVRGYDRATGRFVAEPVNPRDSA
jgi:3',5'-cyclic AMP phosphodiesterase CpdA